MGLSKKLGAVAAPKVDSVVPYKWSTQTYTVQEIIRKFKLPCVVQCATESCTVVWSDFQFDMRQPMLFHSRRSVQKVHAVSLKEDSKEGLVELGPPLAIPVDYEGWFGATPKGLTKVKRHLRIESVAKSTALRILITTKCPAFTSCRRSDGSFDYVPHDVMPGEVLKRVCVMEKDPSNADLPDIVRLHGSCMEFLDEKDEDVVIPFNHRAICYEIAEVYPDTDERVFQISSPVAAGNSKLPRIFQLVHGDPPTLAYTFTGAMRCYSIFTEETVLAATLDHPKSLCLEVATDSVTKFRLGLNESAIKKTCEYTNALQLCQSQGSKFLSNIKVTFSIKPEMTVSEDMSSYESLSDMAEVNANSEFEIAWGGAEKSKLLKSSMACDEFAFVNKALETHEVERGLNNAESKEEMDYSDACSEDTLDNVDLQDGYNELDDKDSVDFEETEIPDSEIKPGIPQTTDNPLYYFMQRNPDKNDLTDKKDRTDKKNRTDKKDRTDKKLLTEGSGQSPQTSPGCTDKTEDKNPFLHLFEPLKFIEDKKLKPVVNENNESTRDVPNLDSEGSRSEMMKHELERELSNMSEASEYKRAVCSPAMEYNDSDDPEDSDSSTSEIGDATSVSSVLGRKLLDGITALDVTSQLYLSEETVQESAVREDAGADAPEDDIFYDSDSGSESQAVDDLLSIAEIESIKLSASTQDLQETGEEELPVTAGADVEVLGESEKDHSDEAVSRLNCLIEEVTALVNSSSNRIIDERRSPRVLHSRLKAPQPDTTNATPHYENIVFFNTKEDDISKKSQNMATPPGTPVLENSLNIQENQVQSSKLSPSPSFKNSQILYDENISFVKTLEVEDTNDREVIHSDGGFIHSKNTTLADFGGVVQGSGVDSNLVPVGQGQLVDTPSPFIKNCFSDSNVTSIPYSENEDFFSSRKITPFPHRHPHKRGGQFSGDVIPLRSVVSDGSDQTLNIQTKDSFLRGKVYKSVQNLERLISPADSLTSFSSADKSEITTQINSYAEFGDSDSENSDEYFQLTRATSESEYSQEADGESDARDESGDSDIFVTDERLLFSKSGKMKVPLKNSLVNCFPFNNIEEYQDEDYV